AKAVEHLHLVTVLQIHPAVSAVLAAAERFERQQEFAVQTEVLIGLLGFATGGEEAAIIEMAAGELVGSLADIEENSGAGRGLRAERRAGAGGFLHRPRTAIRRGDAQSTIGELGLEFVRSGEGNLVAIPFAFGLALRFLVPTGAGQSALVCDELE